MANIKSNPSSPTLTDSKFFRAVIFTGYSCNNRCGFCIDYHKREIADFSTQHLVKLITQARNRGFDYLEIIGGEATIRTDFLALIRMAKKIGFKKVISATNGRRFAHRPFAKAAIEAGIDGIMFSVHGPNEDIHDGLTAAPGSFRQILAGIKNLQNLGFSSIRVNTTVVQQNYQSLPEMAKLYLELKIAGAEVIFVDPSYGGAQTNFRDFVPKISQAAPWMRRCLDIGRSAGTRQWAVRYVPLCHFRGYEDQISETVERLLFHTVHIAPDFRNEDVSSSRISAARIKPNICRACALFNECEGIWKEYFRIYGAEELTPI